MPTTSGRKPRLWMDVLDAVFLIACVWEEIETIDRPGPRGPRLLFLALYAILAIIFAARIWNRRFARP